MEGAMEAPNQSGRASRDPSAQLLLIDRLTGLGRTAIAVAGLAYGVHEVRLAIEALAGEQTRASLLLSFFSSNTAGVAISVSWAGTIAFGGIAFRERKLRQRTIERLTKRIHELESRIDSQRTSSGLTPTGETNPHDR
ncbi:MAG: hypothetical protein GVY28_12725 [Alphaproteobacteria bacterium]|nr:hypothetical protein [Alphaproteobacteria bacterium]